MILEFKTKRNANGNRRFLEIDTDKGIYARNCPRMVSDGAEIGYAAMCNLIERCKADGYKEVDYI